MGQNRAWPGSGGRQADRSAPTVSAKKHPGCIGEGCAQAEFSPCKRFSLMIEKGEEGWVAGRAVAVVQWTGGVVAGGLERLLGTAERIEMTPPTKGVVDGITR